VARYIRFLFAHMQRGDGHSWHVGGLRALDLEKGGFAGTVEGVYGMQYPE
jgi:hypothetical protein